MWEEYIYIRSIVPVLHNKFSWRLHFWACCSNLHGLNSVRGTPTFSCTKELLRCLTFASSDSEKGGDLYVKRIMITSKEPPGNPNSKGLVPSISIAYFVASTQLNHGWDLYQPLLLDRGYAVCNFWSLKVCDIDSPYFGCLDTFGFSDVSLWGIHRPSASCLHCFAVTAGNSEQAAGVQLGLGSIAVLHRW